MEKIFGYISAFFAIASIFPYIRDILRLKTKPQRVTWFIYSVLGSISFFSQRYRSLETVTVNGVDQIDFL